MSCFPGSARVTQTQRERERQKEESSIETDKVKEKERALCPRDFFESVLVRRRRAPFGLRPTLVGGTPLRVQLASNCNSALSRVVGVSSAQNQRTLARAWPSRATQPDRRMMRIRGGPVVVVVVVAT